MPQRPLHDNHHIKTKQELYLIYDIKMYCYNVLAWCTVCVRGRNHIAGQTFEKRLLLFSLSHIIVQLFKLGITKVSDMSQSRL